ncbi:MAG TPA: CHAD domain-containing protein [Vicinamibacterales bacterium]|jgi:CHAD domain-containing protein
MAFRLRPQESVADGLRRLATKEVRSAREDLRRTAPPRDDAIHEARKSVKKVRAVLELVEVSDGCGLGGSNERLRRLNRILSRLRDADAMVGVLADLRARDPHLLSEHTFARVHRHLVSRKREAMENAERDGAWTKVDRELRKVRRAAAKRWRPAKRGFGAVVPGMRLVHRRGRKAMARARKRQTAADFHEWRKQIKALWYALRLVERAGRIIRRDAAALHRAETWLGEAHNVVVLCAELSENASICGGLADLDRVRLIGHQYQCELRANAIAAVGRIYRRKSGPYVRAIKRAWTALRRGHEAAHHRRRDRTAA